MKLNYKYSLDNLLYINNIKIYAKNSHCRIAHDRSI